MDQNLAIIKAAEELGVSLSSNENENLRQLIARINEMIQKDFSGLLSILYRIDVSEEKLKSVLKSQPGNDAAILITQLIIERQNEKLKSKDINKNFGDIPEDEKW